MQPGFDRDQRTIDTYIQPILNRISADKRLALRQMNDGGLSNYFSFLVFDPSVHAPGYGNKSNVPCVAVMLSLMAPVGVYGRSSFSEGPSYFGYPDFEPEQVCDPFSPPDWMSASVVAAVHDPSSYQLIGRDETDQLLPTNVEVYEYCSCAEPWNRVFHALFADTD